MLTRTFKIDIKNVDTFDIKTGKKEIKKRFRFPCHGDIVNSWTILLPSTKGYKPLQFKNFGLYINDNLLNKIKGLTFSNNSKHSICKVDFPIIRSELRNIEMPDTPRNNRLVNIENQFACQSLECLQVPFQKNIKVDPVNKETLMNNLFMGDICIEIDVENYPLQSIIVSENYYDYISSKMYPVRNEQEKDKEKEKGVKNDKERGEIKKIDNGDKKENKKLTKEEMVRDLANKILNS